MAQDEADRAAGAGPALTVEPPKQSDFIPPAAWPCRRSADERGTIPPPPSGVILPPPPGAAGWPGIFWSRAAAPLSPARRGPAIPGPIRYIRRGSRQWDHANRDRRDGR